MKLKYVDEKDFKEIEVEYPDFQVELARMIRNAVGSPIEVLTESTGKKLTILAVDESVDRVQREIFYEGKYRITIEPFGLPTK